MEPVTSTFDPSELDLEEFHYFVCRIEEEAARAYATAELVDDDEFDPVREYQKSLSAMIGTLKKAHGRVGKLRGHRHAWREDDYCSICGQDGRA